MYCDEKKTDIQPAGRFEVVDTTAAGDTFIGFFLIEFIKSADLTKALQIG